MEIKPYAKLIRGFAVCAALVLGTITADAQSGFMKTYGGTGTDSGRNLELTSDGGYIIAGHTTTNSNGFADLFVVRTNGSGDTLWTKKYGGSGVEGGYTIQRTSDGNYIIAGFTTSSFGAGGEDAYLIKINDNGTLLWQKTYGGAGTDRIEAAFETSDGGIIMVGNTNSAPSTSPDLYLIKADASGNMQWSKRFGGAQFDNGNMVQQTSDGGYIVIGQTYSIGAGSGDFWLIKTDASGNMQWDKTYGGAAIDEGKNIRQTSDGGYIIIGDTDSQGAGNSDAYVLKTDASGTIQWQKTYGGADKEAAKMITPTSDGGYVIAAISRSFGVPEPDGWVVKINSTGDTTWTRRFGGYDHEHLYCIRNTTDGGFIAVGHSDSYEAGKLEQVYLVKMNASGNITVGMEDEPFAINLMNVYPNPSNGVFEVELDLNGAPWADIQLMNSSGQTVLSERIENSRGQFHKKIDLGSYAKGIYFLGVSVNDQRTTKKVMIY